MFHFFSIIYNWGSQKFAQMNKISWATAAADGGKIDRITGRNYFMSCPPLTFNKEYLGNFQGSRLTSVRIGLMSHSLSDRRIYVDKNSPAQSQHRTQMRLICFPRGDAFWTRGSIRKAPQKTTRSTSWQFALLWFLSDVMKSPSGV